MSFNNPNISAGCSWLALCISLALFINKVEQHIGWKLFLLGFFLAQIFLYGEARLEAGAIRAPRAPQEEPTK